MAELPGFMRSQLEFARHIRDPDHRPRPLDVDERRMAVYRDLFFNNIESFISTGFPVLRTLYDDHGWQRLVRAFFVTHRCHTPYFMEIAQEFLGYLESEHQATPSDPPFLWELAHYEWVELALQIEDESAAVSDLDPNRDLLDSVPVMSSLAWVLTYRYPVHRIGRDFQPQEAPPQPTFLLVLRDRNDRIRFNEINAVSARLLTLLQDNTTHTGRELLQTIADELQHPDPETVQRGGLQLLQDFQAQGVILGAKPAPNL